MTKLSKFIYPFSKKNPGRKKTSSLSLSYSKSITIPNYKKSTNIINQSDIVRRLSIASSNINFQSYQINNILSKYHPLSTKSSLKAYFIFTILLSTIADYPTSNLQGNVENKKITRVNNTSSLSTKIKLLNIKKLDQVLLVVYLKNFLSMK